MEWDRPADNSATPLSLLHRLLDISEELSRQCDVTLLHTRLIDAIQLGVRAVSEMSVHADGPGTVQPIQADIGAGSAELFTWSLQSIDSVVQGLQQFHSSLPLAMRALECVERAVYDMAASHQGLAQPEHERLQQLGAKVLGIVRAQIGVSRDLICALQGRCDQLVAAIGSPFAAAV